MVTGSNSRRLALLLLSQTTWLCPLTNFVTSAKCFESFCASGSKFVNGGDNSAYMITAKDPKENESSA